MKVALAGIFSALLLIGSDGELSEARRRMDAQEYRDALRHYRIALKQYPDQTAAISYNMALCFLKLDSTKKATQYFQRAISQDNDALSSEAYNHIAISLAQDDKIPAALRNLKKALQLDPNNETARFNYEVLLRKQQPEEQKQQQNSPDSPPPTSEQEKQNREKYMENIERELRRLMGMQKSDAALIGGMDTLSLQEARRVLESMRENELRYQQQMRKSAAPPELSPEGKEKPNW